MSISVIIPAYQAADTIAETARAARAVVGVSQVIVVDDGSRDGTSVAAEQAGADQVIRLPRNQGKGAALKAGMAAASGETLLFLDADLGGSARHAGSLLAAQGSSKAMAIAVLPSPPGAGGFGFLRALARAAIRLLSSLRAEAPVSGQRALPAALARHIGVASGFGVEVGLTVEAAHLGWPIVETPVPFEHRATTRTLAGFRHRGRQFWDVLWLALQIGYGIGWPALQSWRKGLRLTVWLLAFALLLTWTWLISRPALAQVAWAAAALVLWLPALWLSAVWLRLRKPNYLGRSLPTAAGLILPVVALPCLWWGLDGGGGRMAAIIVLAVMGLVGLLDDLFAGSRQARGLRGHLLALLQGRVTTGAVKALGGLAAGAVAGWMLHPGRWGEVALDALLIALCANMVNLLDLRPGRALKGFAILAVIALALRPEIIWLLGPVLAAALVMAPSDFAGRTMMGDVGANALGGVAGLGLALVLGTWARLASVLALLVLHLLCERFSLTDLFARNRLLRAVDRLGTEGLPPLPVGSETAP